MPASTPGHGLHVTTILASYSIIWVQHEISVQLFTCGVGVFPQVTPYAHDELVLIVPRHHELAKRGSIALEQLYTLPLVSLNQVHPCPSRLL